MKIRHLLIPVIAGLICQQASALSLAPEEFLASRQLACVLAEQSLGYLSEDEYGSRTHQVLEAFDDSERDNILAKALGYYDGLMFSLEARDVDQRLQSFVDSKLCPGGYSNANLLI